MHEIKLAKSSPLEIVRKKYKRKLTAKKLGDYDAYNSTVKSKESLAINRNTEKTLFGIDLNKRTVKNLLKLLKQNYRRVDLKSITPIELLALFELKKFSDEFDSLIKNLDLSKPITRHDTFSVSKSSYIFYDCKEHRFKIVTERENILKLDEESKRQLISCLKSQASIVSSDEDSHKSLLLKRSNFCEHCVHCNQQVVFKRVNKEIVKSGDSFGSLQNDIAKSKYAQKHLRNQKLVAELKTVLEEKSRQKKENKREED